MRCGVINNNRPHCPKCLNSDSEMIKIVDVDVAKIDDEPHFEMIARCRKCDIKFYYFLDAEMGKRIVIDKKSERYSRSIRENIQDGMEEEFDED